MRRRGKTIIWPQYFDSKRTRKFGRRLSKEYALPLPSIDEMFEAAKNLGYEPEIDDGAKFPRTWWDPPGLLLVQSHGQKKIFIMEKMAPKIIQLRDKKETQKSEKKSKKRKKKK
jgi:signal recognition particle subunit SRP19